MSRSPSAGGPSDYSEEPTDGFADLDADDAADADDGDDDDADDLDG